MKQADLSPKMQHFRRICVIFGSQFPRKFPLNSRLKSGSQIAAFAASAFLAWGAAPSIANPVYVPLPLVAGQELNDALSDRDIPTGQGGFARDYSVELKTGDQIAIDLVSEVFDPMVVLMSKDGTTIAENDDGPDGTPNSLLFVRIVKSGTYVVRVRSFGETAGGRFRLLLTQLVRK